jgi:hypothetical protein
MAGPFLQSVDIPSLQVFSTYFFIVAQSYSKEQASLG